MSKCRPEAGLEFAAISDFLRSVHINGEPLHLPGDITQIHIHPRLSLNMARTMDHASFERTAAAFDVAEATQRQADIQVHHKLDQLDKRLDAILERLEGKSATTR